MKLITLLQNQMMPLFCKIMVNGKIVSLKIFHFWWILSRFKGFPGSSDGQESVHNTEDLSLISGSARSPREWMQLTPVFLPGEIHGQRSLVGYSLWGCKESDMTEWLILSLNILRKILSGIFLLSSKLVWGLKSKKEERYS